MITPFNETSSIPTNAIFPCCTIFIFAPFGQDCRKRRLPIMLVAFKKAGNP